MCLFIESFFNNNKDSSATSKWKNNFKLNFKSSIDTERDDQNFIVAYWERWEQSHLWN